MSTLSKWFSWAEVVITQQREWIAENERFARRFTEHVTLHARQLMDPVGDLLGQPVHVSSWVRCLGLNRQVGGSDRSDHVIGPIEGMPDVENIGATDFIAPAFGSAYDVATAIAASPLQFRQLIYEHTWVHISSPRRVRGAVEPARRQILTLRPDGRGYVAGIVRKADIK